MALPHLHLSELRNLPYAVNVNESRPVDILIADDEPIIRRLLEATLRAAGLRVVTAANGAEALCAYRRHEGKLSLVLLDVHMPELDGPQTLEALRQIAPDVRVVFMSGGSAAYSVEDLLATGAVGFVHKPFRDLDEVVERLCNLVTSPAHTE